MRAVTLGQLQPLSPVTQGKGKGQDQQEEERVNLSMKGPSRAFPSLLPTYVVTPAKSSG